MKIISGKLQGRKIHTSKDNDYRPTTGRVKEAIFSILSSGEFLNQDGYTAIDDAVTIDVFGGTGALTFEAISRGAKQSYIIESNITHIKDMEINISKLGIGSQIKIIRGSATALPKSEVRCNIAFIDPPFNKGLINDTVKSLVEQNWLSKNAIIVIENHHKDLYNIEQYAELLKSRRYGDAILSIYRLK